MSGPTGKSTERRARGRKPRATVIPQLVIVPEPDPPSMPVPSPAWLVETQQAWRVFWASPLESHVISGDHAALMRLFDLRDQQARFWRIGLKEPMVQGSTGQWVINPLLKRGDDLEGKILALEDRFGASPRARLALVQALGDAGRSLKSINASVVATDPRVQQRGPVAVEPLDLEAMDGISG